MMRYRPSSVVPAMKLPSPRELVEEDRGLFGVLLTSFGGGWRTVGCVPVNAAPQEGQLRLFSVTAVEQAGHLLIIQVSYKTYLTPTSMLLTT